MANRSFSYDEKEEIRVIYTQCNLPKFIRQFAPYSKIGDAVHQYELIYDNNYNLINVLYTDGRVCVDNLDVRVPERPIITVSSEILVSGTCGTGAVGEIVKDGDIVVIIDLNTKDTNTNNLRRHITNKILGEGIINSNAFSVNIDVSSYSTGTQIALAVLVYNERFEKHGTSQHSEIVYITKS